MELARRILKAKNSLTTAYAGCLRISEAERQEIVAAAQEAWETVNFASVENDDAVWKEVFGPGFKVED